MYIIMIIIIIASFRTVALQGCTAALKSLPLVTD